MFQIVIDKPKGQKPLTVPPEYAQVLKKMLRSNSLTRTKGHIIMKSRGKEPETIVTVTIVFNKKYVKKKPKVDLANLYSPGIVTSKK